MPLDTAYGFKVDMAVPIQIVGKARPRVLRNGRVYTPKKTVVVEKSIATVAKAEMQGHEPYDGPLACDASFIFVPPKSWSKKKREEAIKFHDPVERKPDIDNALKTALDALNGIVYPDDKKVTDVRMSKYYGSKDKVLLSFWGIKCEQD